MIGTKKGGRSEARVFLPIITLTREALYGEVWSTSMLKIAAAFDLSNRGLAKLCQRHKVAVPPRG